MQKTIEVVYESGIFRPLKKVDFKEGEKAKVIVERRNEKGIIQLEDIKGMEEAFKNLPKSKISIKKLDEIYYEGKMLD